MISQAQVNGRFLSQGNSREQYFTLNGIKKDEDFFVDFVKKMERMPSAKISKITVLGNARIARQFLQQWSMYPTVFIGNSESDVCSHDNIGICVHMIVGEIESFEYIVSHGNVIGSFWMDEHRTYLSVVNVNDNLRKRKDVKRELESIYKKIDEILHAYKMTARDIYRFWNFLHDVSRDYGVFNNVRDAYFVKNGIDKYPAATGIESRLQNGMNANICFDAFSHKMKEDVSFKIVHSDMQCEAWLYGPRFSRAAVFGFVDKKGKKMMISGTSSIGKHGASIYKGNVVMNVAYTMRSIEHLLKKERMGLNNVLSAFVYVKNETVLEVFVHLYAKKKWNFPYNVIYTNICRKDLIFEMECVAATECHVINVQ